MASNTNYGATPDDWDHFDLILGLGEDLLPVVSNPDAEKSPESKVKDLGKTPSIYNKAGQVVGMAGWTAQRSTDKDITRWSRVPDYGICIQTRQVRALDIDVADEAAANLIADAIECELGIKLPMRRRPNSGKCLLAFTLVGEYGKRKVEVEGGIVEFLATGQQFIAIGTHPSGVRYEWRDGLPYEFPEIPAEAFEHLWDALVSDFGTGAAQVGGVTVRQRGERQDIADPVADYLAAQGRVLGEDRDGALVVACPWEHEHSTGTTGDGSTVWFPAGTNGYPSGHFKCLHGHCAGRTDQDFKAAVGFVEDVAGEFDVVEHKGDAEPAPLPRFKRDRQGRIESTIDNAVMAVRRPDVCGVEIRFDRFRDEIVFSVPGRGEWQKFLDPDYSRLRINLERGGFKSVGRELIRDAVLLVAVENGFDTAIEWLAGLQWDGVPRVEGFLANYFGAEAGAYTSAVSRYMWSALAGRVMQPGAKADMVPVLVGEQGIRKSTGVAAIAPAVEHFVEVRLDKRDEDAARELRGKLIGELGELRGLMSRDSEDIKQWIAKTHEEWVPKYQEFSVKVPRRLLFIGTTNRDEFLVDDTGNRRWLPVRVTAVDSDAIVRDRLQLWAEGRVMFERDGIEFREAEELARDVHDEHMVKDAWLDVVRDWLDDEDPLTGDKPLTRKFLRVHEVLDEALHIDIRNVQRREELRVAAILRTLGYSRKKVKIHGKTIWAFVPQGS